MADSICKHCYHNYVCEQYNEHRDYDNEKCHFYNDHFIDLESVEPVKRGRWFMRGGIFRCSECDSKALLKLDSNVGGCREYTHFRSNYCPHCGAKMDGDGNV